MNSRLPYCSARCSGVAVPLFQIPCRSGSPHGVLHLPCAFGISFIGVLPSKIWEDANVLAFGSDRLPEGAGCGGAPCAEMIATTPTVIAPAVRMCFIINKGSLLLLWCRLL